MAFLLKSQEIEFLIALTCFQVVVCGTGPRPCKILANKVIGKVRRTRHWNPLFGPVWSHRGRHFKTGRKSTLGFNGASKFSLAANLVLNSVCLVLSFVERFQPITATICAVAINVLDPGAFNPESQYFIPLFNKIHDFVDNNQEQMKHPIRGATQAQPALTLWITLLF